MTRTIDNGDTDSDVPINLIFFESSESIKSDRNPLAPYYESNADASYNNFVNNIQQLQLELSIDKNIFNAVEAELSSNTVCTIGTN